MWRPAKTREERPLPVAHQPFTGPGAAAVRVEQLTRVYAGPGQRVTALAGIDALFVQGTFTAVMVPRVPAKVRCCKPWPDSTGDLRTGPDRCHRAVIALRDRLTKLRRSEIGFVFQAFNLIGALTVEENIMLPLRLAKARPDRRWIAEVIERVGLEQRLRHRPTALSGGQQQRVAIARALAIRPKVIFCGEPTGALDTQTAAEVLSLLRAMVTEQGQTIIMVTHDPVAASYADRVVVLADGRIVSDMPQPGAGAIAEELALLGRPARAVV